MSRAVCIPFHRYHPHYGEYYRVWMNALLNGLAVWGKEFDKLYLIDDYWDFNFEEIDRLSALKIPYEIIKRQRDGHHWIQFKTAFPHIKEDHVLCLDNDVLIWQEGVVNSWFAEAETGKFVTAFDGSGGLSEPMQKRFLFLGALKAHRMGSYYFILNREQLELAKQTDLAPVHYEPNQYIEELNYTTKEGDWQDSFGVLTYKILSKDPVVHLIDDDRSSIYLEDDGTINKVPSKPMKLGYYHVRNGGHTTYLLSSKLSGAEEDYKHALAITPRRELLRIMAWHYLAGGYVHVARMLEIAQDVGLDKETWHNYLEEFRRFHGLK